MSGDSDTVERLPHVELMLCTDWQCCQQWAVEGCCGGHWPGRHQAGDKGIVCGGHEQIYVSWRKKDLGVKG